MNKIVIAPVNTANQPWAAQLSATSLSDLRAVEFNQFNAENLFGMYLEGGIVALVVPEMPTELNANLKAYLKKFWACKTFDEVQLISKLMMDEFEVQRAKLGAHWTPELYKSLDALPSPTKRNLPTNFRKIHGWEGNRILRTAFNWETLSLSDDKKCADNGKKKKHHPITIKELAGAIFGDGKLRKFQNAAEADDVTSTKDPRGPNSTASNRAKLLNLLYVFIHFGIVELTDEDKDMADRRVVFTEKGVNWFLSLLALAEKQCQPRYERITELRKKSNACVTSAHEQRKKLIPNVLKAAAMIAVTLIPGAAASSEIGVTALAQVYLERGFADHTYATQDFAAAANIAEAGSKAHWVAPQNWTLKTQGSQELQELLVNFSGQAGSGGGVILNLASYSLSQEQYSADLVSFTQDNSVLSAGQYQSFLNHDDGVAKVSVSQAADMGDTKASIAVSFDWGRINDTHTSNDWADKFAPEVSFTFASFSGQAGSGGGIILSQN